MKRILITYGELQTFRKRMGTFFESRALAAAFTWFAATKYIGNVRDSLAACRNRRQRRMAIRMARIRNWPAWPRVIVASLLVIHVLGCLGHEISGGNVFFFKGGWMTLAAVMPTALIIVLLFSEKAHRNVWPERWA